MVFKMIFFEVLDFLKVFVRKLYSKMARRIEGTTIKKIDKPNA